ncbi:MAG: glutaredoxin [Myxococcota bacterium]|nr:glutaredoxin [Myxococcota bacterium]
MSTDERHSESEPVRVKIYTLSTCGYCWMAKRLLQSYAQPFEELDVRGQPDLRRWLAEVSGQRTVPQIFIDGESIGGYRELSALDRSGRLRELLGPDAGEGE